MTGGGREQRETEPQRILVTGANGFVGRHLIAHLLATADEDRLTVRIYAAVPPDHVAETAQPSLAFPETIGWRGGTEDGRVEVVGMEICDAQSVAAMVAHTRPLQIYHLAARASGADADRDAVFAVNAGGTRHLLEAASTLSPFPRVLLVSTGYVYGNTDPTRPAREEDPIGPLWHYGPYTDSKIEMETVAKGYRAFTLTARAFAHTGPGQRENFAIPGFAQQLARIELGFNSPELRVGNLSVERDLLDVRDVVRAYRLLMHHGHPGETYNVATGRPLSLQTVLDRLRALCAVPTGVVVDPSRLRAADILCSTGDPACLKATTGWEPRLSLETTLRDTLDYWRAVTAREVS